jgi:GNAT superfamily N-acetyltransferase
MPISVPIPGDIDRRTGTLTRLQGVMMLSPARLEAYMRSAAALTHEVIEQPPFVLYLNPTDAFRFYNYAKPLEPAGGDLGQSLAKLIAAFEAHERMPRFEFVAEYAPDLPPALEAAGFAREDRNVLLTCTPKTFRPAPAIDGLEIITLGPDSPDDDLIAASIVQQIGFGDGHEINQPDPAALARKRQRLARAGAFLARLHSQPICAGEFTAPLDGLTELVGIATLPDYRKRGAASALTAAATQNAFARGVEIAFMSAADERAGRVYQRVGYQPYATMLAYSKED